MHMPKGRSTMGAVEELNERREQLAEWTALIEPNMMSPWAFMVRAFPAMRAMLAEIEMLKTLMRRAYHHVAFVATRDTPLGELAGPIADEMLTAIRDHRVTHAAEVDWRSRALAAERERDDLRGLLREARSSVLEHSRVAVAYAEQRGNHEQAIDIEADVEDLRARISAAIITLTGGE